MKLKMMTNLAAMLPAAGLMAGSALACGFHTAGDAADSCADATPTTKEHAAAATMIASCGDAGSCCHTTDAAQRELTPEEEALFTELVAKHVAQATFQALNPRHQEMLASAINQHLGEDAKGGPIPAFCFVTGTDERTVSAFKGVFDDLYPNRYQLTNRWSGNVASGPAGSVGEPITLTWSFVPDGTFVPNGVGEGSGNSNLFAAFDAFYGGNTAAWQDVYFRMFDRWEEITGLNYVYEPNDDGAPLFDSPGELGVRGDLRMAGKPIDGNSGILAYNFFPQGGDMVLDTADNFYADTSNNSQRLFNILKHEHGHGMGLLHVCPIEESKLMEPFISLNFTGAQHDDIRGAHRLYGDFYEPNDAISLASDLGNVAPGDLLQPSDLPSPNVSFGARTSIETNDDDYFRLNATEPASLTVAANPVGLNYQDNPQACGGAPGSCCSGDFIQSNNQGDLRITVFNASGQVLADQNATGLGAAESIVDLELPVAGEYFVRITATNNPSQVQLYDATFIIEEAPFLGPLISTPSGTPSEVDPGVTTSFPVVIDPRDDSIVPGSEILRVRGDGGAFQSVPLTPTGNPGEFDAVLPAFDCDDSPEFFIQAEGATDGVVTFPPTAPSNVFDALVGSVVVTADLDFETSPGWTVSSTATDGQWDRGVPVNNGRDDPPADFDGSGQCWLTDNDPVDDNSDVDGGSTTLISPAYNVPGAAEVSYAFWFADSVNTIGSEDFYRVDISFDNGASWNTRRTYTAADTQNAWQTDAFPISEAEASANVRVRFVVAENDPGDVLEAGLDAFSIVGVDCTEPVGCPGDLNGDGNRDGQDLVALLANFGESTVGGPGAGDFDNNGVINGSDLVGFLGVFGNPCP